MAPKIFFLTTREDSRSLEHDNIRLSALPLPISTYLLIYCTMGFTDDVAAQTVETHTKKTYPTSIEDTNLAGIGSDEDRKARENASRIDQLG